MTLLIERCGYVAGAVVAFIASNGWAVPIAASPFSADQMAPGVTAPADHAKSPSALTLEERADIFMARKNYGDAVDYYYRSLKQSSFKNAVVWNKLGIAYQVQAKFRFAQKAYSNASRIKHDFAEPWNNMGTLYYMEKKYARSVRYYERAIALANNNASFHMNLGTSYYHLKKYNEAVEEYRTALGIDPQVMTQVSSTGTVIHASGADVEFYYYLAKAFASVGDAEDAVRYLRRAMEEGLKDPKRIDDDPDFKKISQFPAFVELRRNPPVSIKE
jgi:tetratricopeptide (TPR) repeat protein